MSRTQTPLTRDRILEEALIILDEQGFSGLSMRKLAHSLGVEAMSLYNHIKDKQDLLDGLCDRVLASIEAPELSLPWRDRLEIIAMRLYSALLQHPALVIVLASEQGKPGDLKVIQGMDIIAAALAESGLSPQKQVSAFRGLLAICFGFVLAHTQGLSKTKEQAQVGWSQWDSHKWSEAAHPHLFHLAPQFLITSADDDFKFMLNAYLSALNEVTVHHEDSA
jgi:TetR/AcrR family transcriptional regulator, tetracycline repressor protein